MSITARDITATSTRMVNMVITTIAITMRAARSSIPTAPITLCTPTTRTITSTTWDK